MSEGNKKSFLMGAAILGIAGLLVQVLGAVFRIPLANIIGDEGMGYYQTAYPIYIFLLVFSTNGAPAAISKMTSERIARGQYGEAHRVFRLAFLLMFLFGVVTSSVVFFGAETIVTYLKNPGALYAMMAIAPALLFVPVMSVFRGYFQGYQDMSPTATSQLVEQLIRVAVGLSLAFFLVPVGIEYAAAGASAGGSIGPVFGTLFLLLLYGKKRKSMNLTGGPAIEGETSGKILTKLASIAIPITIGVSILPIMNIMDLLLVMRRLQAIGFSESAANELYGQLSGLVGPIINIPQALALAVALSLVPAVAAAKSVNDLEFMRQNISMSLRTAMIIGVPCSLGLMILAKPIMMLIYPMQMESAVNSASCLMLMGAGVIFIAIAQTMAGVLQGLGKPSLAVYSLLIGVVVKGIATYLLVGIESLNINGAAIGTTLAYAAVALSNFFFVKKETGTAFSYDLAILRPVVSGLVMSAATLLVYFGGRGFLGERLSTVLSIGVAACVYCVMLIKIKAILAEEIKMLPKGEKLYRILKKCRLI